MEPLDNPNQFDDQFVLTRRPLTSEDGGRDTTLCEYYTLSA
jgi:hypothetical protein